MHWSCDGVGRVVAGVLVSVLAGCAAHSSSTGAGPRPRPPAGVGSTSSVRSQAPRHVVAPTSTTTVAVEPPGWFRIADVQGAVAVDLRVFRLADGADVTVARFRVHQTRFALHVGTEDPPTGGIALPGSAGPAVIGSERRLLIAAFNGGFKVSSGSGGFVLNGMVLRPLLFGRATFVIDRDGSGHLGVLGQGLPTPGEQVASVRQNLSPLVFHGVLSPSIADVGVWGATFKGESVVARSALGRDPQGNVLYAASMAVLPIDLAGALIDAGATNAMELDINPEWVQLALAARAGGALIAGVAGQHRPADQYLTGWTRDFITVLSAT
jgi:hypothetical protein